MLASRVREGLPVERPNWAPEHVDLDSPSPARVHDFLLGGSHHVEADRSYAKRLLDDSPDAATVARAQRAFLHRAVRYLNGCGVRQFIDLGSTPETAPDARDIYVDNDPVAVAHARAILAGSDRAAVVDADLCEPAEVLAARPLRGLIDMSQPVGYLLVGVLGAMGDEGYEGDVIAGYAAASTPGSHLVVAGEHGNLAALLDDLELVAPGVVPLAQWRPDSASEAAPAPAAGLAAVARKD
jgi:hypothetical protein